MLAAATVSVQVVSGRRTFFGGGRNLHDPAHFRVASAGQKVEFFNSPAIGGLQLHCPTGRQAVRVCANNDDRRVGSTGLQDRGGGREKGEGMRGREKVSGVRR